MSFLMKSSLGAKRLGKKCFLVKRSLEGYSLMKVLQVVVGEELGVQILGRCFLVRKCLGKVLRALVEEDPGVQSLGSQRRSWWMVHL